MTATELYPLDCTLRAFISEWVRERRSPAPLPDYLLEQGLELQGEGAYWCVLQPDLPQFVGEYRSGPFPCEGSWQHNYWHRFQPEGREYANEVPLILLRHLPGGRSYSPTNFKAYPTETEAILALLDGWALALAAGEDLPRPLTQGICP